METRPVPNVTLPTTAVVAVSRPAVLAVALAAVLVMLTRLPFFFWPLTGDEGNYSYTAYWWSRGVPLYVDGFGLEKPQGVYVAYVVAQYLLGLDTWAVRLMGALWAAATAVAVYVTARRLFGHQAGAAAGVLFAVLSSAPHLDGFTANAEVMMVLPLTLSVFCLSNRRYGVAGALAGVALLFKVSAVSGLILAVFWLIYCKGSRRDWLALCLGAALPLLVGLLHGIATSGLGAYLYSVALFRASGGWGEVPNLTVAAIRGWSTTAGVWMPLALLGAVGTRACRGSTRILIGAWMATSLLGASMGGGWTSHYFLQLVPPLSVAAGAGFVWLWSQDRVLARIEAVGIPLICFLLFEGSFFLQSPLEGCWSLYHRPGLQVSRDVAAYIRSNTNENDSIYVAFWQADIYHLARRRSALPYISRVQLLYSADSRRRLMDMIEAREPVYVLGLNVPNAEVDPDGRFLRALEDGYEVEKRFDGVPLYRRRD